MTIRVCHLTSVHPHDDVRIFVKECSSLGAAGYEVHLIAAGANDEVRNGIRVHGAPSSGAGRVARMTRTAWAVYRKALAVDAALYHFHDAELIPVGLLLRAHGRLVIYDIHEDMPRAVLAGRDYLPPLLRRVMSVLIGILERVASRALSGLVVATPPIAARFPTTINTAVVHNYPIRDELSPRGAFGPLLKRAACLAYVGALSPERGLFQMVEAAAMIPAHHDATLCLAGHLPDGLREYIERLPGWKRTAELGILDRSGVASLLGRARLGLVTLLPTPAYVDSVPTKLFEYMSAGIPVIASNFPAWRGVVEEARCGLLVDPSDPQSIAGAIEYLIAHPDEAAEMGRRGRMAVEERYNWETEAGKLLDLYSALLGPGRPMEEAPVAGR